MRTTKKLLTLCTISAVSLFSLVACSKDTTTSLKDGVYTKTAAEAENGYIHTMSMTVKDGKISEINWDGTDADGNKKSQLSLDGKYVMTPDGPTWAAQSEALSKHVIEKQSTSELKMDEQGKTDAVSGVSIKIKGFVDFADALIEEATKK